MKTFPTFFAIRCTVDFAVLVAGGLLSRVLYGRAMRKCKARLERIYSVLFEQRSATAQSVHPSLALAVHRSKAAIDRAILQEGTSIEPAVAMKQVSEWLKGATDECDRAFRSLEDHAVARIARRER